MTSDPKTLRLVCSELSVDVRLTRIRGRWVASADTPVGPSLGLAWFPLDALAAALKPYGSVINELLESVPEELNWR